MSVESVFSFFSPDHVISVSDVFADFCCSIFSLLRHQEISSKLDDSVQTSELRFGPLNVRDVNSASFAVPRVFERQNDIRYL